MNDRDRALKLLIEASKQNEGQRLSYLMWKAINAPLPKDFVPDYRLAENLKAMLLSSHKELAEKKRTEELAAMLMIQSGMTIDKEEAIKRITQRIEKNRNCKHQWRYRVGDIEYCADCGKHLENSSTIEQGAKEG